MARRKIGLPIVRAVIMLTVGTGAVCQELFLRPHPDLIKVYVGLGLMLGPAVIEAWWRARNPTQPELSSPPASSPSASP